MLSREGCCVRAVSSNTAIPQLRSGLLPPPRRRGRCRSNPLLTSRAFLHCAGTNVGRRASPLQAQRTYHKFCAGLDGCPSRGFFTCLSAGTALPVTIRDTCHLLHDLPGAG